MDKFKAKTRSARNRLAEATSSGNGQGSLHAPHSSLAPHDNSSTHAVNEGFLGPLSGSAARDFAVPENQPVQQPVIEPPTSLQSSVDAGKNVPSPPTKHAASSSRFARARSDSAPTRGSSQPRRPQIPAREASIGIRRGPSSTALHQVAQQPNSSTQRLNAPLPALDEDCALGQVPTHSSASSSGKVEHSRLRKVKSAVQSRVPFWSSSKEKEVIPSGEDAANQQSEGQSMDYTSGMVDVLDTVGRMNKCHVQSHN